MLYIDKLIFYNAIICPYAQRAAIALKEVEDEEVQIDLANKPDW
jgi:glutathione S-transferase